MKGALSVDGRDKVLVIDRKGCTNPELLGDMTAESVVKNNWQTVIINNCIRDVDTINTLTITVKHSVLIQ